MGTDDWPADSLIGHAAIHCPGGEVVWLNPVTPVCPRSDRIHLRGALGYSCVTMAAASGEAEPRLTGVALFRLNANFDGDHAGPVWGAWQLVPTDRCDLQELEDPEVYWQGTWRGRRTRICGEGQCRWVGDLKYVGRGHGGSLDGLHFKGEEVVVTFSPLPAPYELLGICPPSGPCPAEGWMRGTLRER